MMMMTMTMMMKFCVLRFLNLKLTGSILAPTMKEGDWSMTPTSCRISKVGTVDV